MASYLTYLYCCNKNEPILIHVAHTLDKTFENIARLGGINSMFWTNKAIETYFDYNEMDANDGIDVDNFLKNAISEDKFLRIDVPKKYFNKFVDDNIKYKIDDCSLRKSFDIFIVKTKEDGTFTESFDEMHERGFLS